MTNGCADGAVATTGEKVRTLESDWVEANKEYMKFQKMNPIFGIGRGKY